MIPKLLDYLSSLPTPGVQLITVIVDTTTTFVDVMMKSTSWMQLLTLCHDSHIQIVLPEVVLRETARHWQAEAAQALDTANHRIVGIKKSRDRLVELGVDASSLVDSTPVAGSPNQTQFEEATLAKLVSLGVQVSPVPDHVNIETVLQRDLARQKPFSKSGKGFRDTLVWETVKQVTLSSGVDDTTIFVTDNSTDYCDEAGSFATELLDEVTAAAGELLRVANLEQLLKLDALAPFVAGLAKTDEELAKFLSPTTAANALEVELPTVDQIVKDAIIHAIDQLAGEEVETRNEATAGLDFTELSIPKELEGLSIDTIDPDENTLNWQTYETYDDTTLLIQAEIDATISLLGFAYKSDISSLDEPEHVHVLEWDWNDHMAYVSTSTNARLIFQIRLEQGLNFVEECEFEGVKPLDDEDPHPWKGTT